MQSITDTAKKDLAWKAVSDASERADLERRHPPRTYTDKISVKLTDDELRRKVADLAEARTLTEQLESDKREASQALKTHEEHVEVLTAAICSGEEERELELRETYYWNVGAVRVVRVDTGELVSERPITAEDRQQDLFDGDEGDEP